MDKHTPAIQYIQKYYQNEYAITNCIFIYS